MLSACGALYALYTSRGVNRLAFIRSFDLFMRLLAGGPMFDVVYILIGLAAFAVTALYLPACDGL